MEFARFVLARLLGAAWVTVAVITVTFMMLHLVPGDPVQIILGADTDPQHIAALRGQLGLDRPLPVQFADYAGRVLRGDLGTSFVTRQPVWTMVSERLPKTLLLAACGLGAGMLMGIPLGIWAAVRQHRRQRDSASFTLGTTVLLATPDFLLATVLVFLFAVTWRLLPVAGAEGPASLVLPSFALGIPLAGIQARVTRTAVLDTMDRDFVRTLRSVGVSEPRILLQHVVANAAIPVITLLSVEFGRLLAGALIVENVFAWPGLGTVIFDSISRRDLPAVQGEVLIVAMLIVVVNFAVDILYRLIDPRVQTA